MGEHLGRLGRLLTAPIASVFLQVVAAASSGDAVRAVHIPQKKWVTTTLAEAFILASKEPPGGTPLERVYFFVLGMHYASLTSSPSEVLRGGLPERVYAAPGGPQDVERACAGACVLASGVLSS